jgi:hypothetical protein
VRPAAPPIVNLSVERYSSLFGHGQRGLELLHQPRGASLVSIGAFVRCGFLQFVSH